MSKIFYIILLLLPGIALAGDAQSLNLHLTGHGLGWISVGLFLMAYIGVITEEFTGLAKSTPVMLAAGLIWLLVAYLANSHGQQAALSQAIDFNIVEFSDLFFFLFVTIIFVNALEDQWFFSWLRSSLVGAGLSYRQLFWVSGIIAFFLSAVLNNLTTAILLCAVIMAIAEDKPDFVCLCAINIVLSANAGGVFDPFGDITTLMVWEKGFIGFTEFFHLFLPALISYLIPAIFLFRKVPGGTPTADSGVTNLKKGTGWLIAIFALTMVFAAYAKQALNLPASIPMVAGLGLLWFYDKWQGRQRDHVIAHRPKYIEYYPTIRPRIIFAAQWDTLLFFYGVMMSVGGLALFGYLHLLSATIYPTSQHLLQTSMANIFIGLLSAVIDNVPVIYAVLTMHPIMSHSQWLLVTLTSGIGGSILAVGSAAGVALLGQTKGAYTFMKHLRWTPVIILGYAAGIACHLMLMSS